VYLRQKAPKGYVQEVLEEDVQMNRSEEELEGRDRLNEEFAEIEDMERKLLIARIAKAQREACAKWLEQAGRGWDGRGPIRAERVRSTPLVTQ
jgi:hypothetical protein